MKRIEPPLPLAGEATRAPARRVRVCLGFGAGEHPHPGRLRRLSPLPQAGEGNVALVAATRFKVIMTRPLHSLLYLPANRASAIAKARTLPADAVLLDLEDAVQPEAKPEARAAAVAARLEGGWEGKHLLLRVNGLGTAWQARGFRRLCRF